MWAFSEITCIILVFSVPALPKLLAESAVFSKFAKSMRSWTRSKSSKDSKDRSFTRTVITRPPRPYRLPEEYTDPLDPLCSRTELSFMHDKMFLQAETEHAWIPASALAKSVAYDYHTSPAPIQSMNEYAWMEAQVGHAR